MLKYAKITTLNENECKVTFIGETVESQMPYYRLATYTPILNDMVAVDDVAKIIIGKVVK